jgi:hypothetical protein
VTAYADDAAGDLLTAMLQGCTGNPSNPIAPENLVEESREPGEVPAICSTVACEAAEKGFSTAGLREVPDGMSAILRGQMAQQLRGFSAKAQGFDNDVIIGATAIERGSPLITGDRALYNAVNNLGGEARLFRPGG